MHKWGTKSDANRIKKLQIEKYVYKKNKRGKESQIL